MKTLSFLLILLALYGCTKNNNEPRPSVTIDMPEVTMNYDGSHQFVLNQGSVRVQSTDYTWTVSNPIAGSISDAGLFTAKRIGDTFVYGTPKTVTGDKVSARVSVKPYFTTWGPVITTWGINKASVKLAETRSYNSENGTSILYYGENSKIRAVLYGFENNGLSLSGVSPENTVEVAKETATFLKERYEYMGAKDGVYAFTDNKSVGIALTISDYSGLSVVYFPYKKGGRLSAPSPARSIPQLPAAKAFDKASLTPY